MTTYNVQEAKTRLSELLGRVERGEEIVIARSGSPVARLVPAGPLAPREFGGVEMTIPPDFDAPLTEDELATWE
jgi:prevent-host-death family protein